MVLPHSHRISRVLCYSGYPHAHFNFGYGTITLFCPAFQPCSPIDLSQLLGPNPKNVTTLGLGSCNFARHYSHNRCFTFFSSRYLDVSVSWVPLHALSIHAWMTGFFPAGFPHSDICGSLLPNGSPQLFAVWHVLLQFRVARHSPYALPYLISGFRVFFEIFLHKNCFLTTVSFLHTFSVNLTTFVIDLFCYVFFMLFSFQRSIIEKSFDPSKPNKNYPLRKISISYIFSFSLERR